MKRATPISRQSEINGNGTENQQGYAPDQHATCHFHMGGTLTSTYGIKMLDDHFWFQVPIKLMGVVNIFSSTPYQSAATRFHKCAMWYA